MGEGMIKAIFLLVGSLLVAVPAMALNDPDRSPYDHRIRTVDYNSQDVVQLNTIAGVATRIELQPGEEYITHNFGDSHAYFFAQTGRYLFIKPRAENADTNLGVVTNKRTYDFRLTLLDGRMDATYALRFRYPEEEARAAREALRREAVESAFEVERDNYNLAYQMGGDTEIAPANVWDNGEMTWFKFPPGVDLPNIYLADNEGNESIANRTTQGEANNIIMVHATSPRWVLRLGDDALAIINDGFDPNRTVNDTGTTSPTVRRVVKEGN